MSFRRFFFACLALLGALALTAPFAMAQSGDPAQPVLTLADLPDGATLVTEHALRPNSLGNGYMNREGQDCVHGYIDGARTGYIVPVGANGMSVYMSSYVYRFADQRAAATEYARLQHWMRAHATDISIDAGHMVTFHVDYSEGAGSASRTTFIHRGPYVAVLFMDGLLNPTVGLELPSGDGGTVVLTQEWVDSAIAAIDDMYSNAGAALAGK
ncbi:MAG: hypothetical protein MI924_09220 [Chloroflexales bacterium]|nr:hypothetical protein [Chloroflexales bacterium]